MIIETIYPSEIGGTLKAPTSKSVVQRLIAVALLADGQSKLHHYTVCDDAIAAIKVAETLGADIQIHDDVLHIQGIAANYLIEQKADPIEINCHESGLSSRLFTPIALLFNKQVTVNGTGSLLKRPFGSLMRSVFEQLCINFVDQDGFLPIQLEGKLAPGHIVIDGSGGSQFLTGLLMSLPLLDSDSSIEVTDLKSKPYIDLTLSVLKESGIYIEHHNYKSFTIPGKQSYKAQDYYLEGDWSGASCLLVAGAIAGSIKISNLDPKSTQGDKAIMQALHDCGAALDFKDNCVLVSRKNLNCFNFDATDCPDLFPALVALAANCEGVTKLTGVDRLITKESNRAISLQSEFAKLGIKIDLDVNDMLITGGQLTGGKTWAHNDHRIAMSLATAALCAQAPVSIEGADCVAKSYPHFWSELASVQIPSL